MSGRLTNELYYFSGTGNTLHAARELKRRLSNTALIPIISALNNKPVKTKADIVGIIFPIHAFSFPWVVKKILQNIDLSSASYLYAISTRICFARVFSDINKIFAEQNRSLDAYFSFETPQIYIPVFETYSREKIEETESKMLKTLDFAADIIRKKEKHQPKDRKSWIVFSHIIYPLVTRLYEKIRFPDMEKSFYTDSNCTGCGVCEKVCLSGKIKSVNGKPVWQKNIKCTYCFACLHFCPAGSIQIKKRNTEKRGRYHHSSITAKDISEQKTADISLQQKNQ